MRILPARCTRRRLGDACAGLSENKKGKCDTKYKSEVCARGTPETIEKRLRKITERRKNVLCVARVRLFALQYDYPCAWVRICTRVYFSNSHEAVATEILETRYDERHADVIAWLFVGPRILDKHLLNVFLH